MPVARVWPIQPYILKHFKNATLDLMPEDQIIPVIDNEMVKSDQLACIRYKNQNNLA